eukprot:scaffold6090_cov326-Prasinococcus_capsulatus_cf.AAC.2
MPNGGWCLDCVSSTLHVNYSYLLRNISSIGFEIFFMRAREERPPTTCGARGRPKGLSIPSSPSARGLTELALGCWESRSVSFAALGGSRLRSALTTAQLERPVAPPWTDMYSGGGFLLVAWSLGLYVPFCCSPSCRSLLRTVAR